MTDLFNIFSLAGVENAIEEYEYTEYLEEGGGTSKEQLANKLTDLRIKMTDRDLVTFPSDGFLQCHFKIVKEDGSDHTEGKIAPVNDGMSLFKRAKYLLSNEIVEDIDRIGIVRHLKGLIEYSDDFARGMGSNMLFVPDNRDGDVSGKITVTTTNPVAVGNTYTLQALVGADPHVVGLSANTSIIAADPLDLFFNGRPITVYRQPVGAGPLIPIQLLAKNVGGTEIHYAGITNADIVYFYVENQEIYIKDTDKTGTKANIGNYIIDAQLRLHYFDVTANVITEFVGAGIDNMVNTGYENRRLRAISDPVGAPYTTDNLITMYYPLRRIFPLLATENRMLRGLEQEFNFDLNDSAKSLFRNSLAVDGKIELHRLSAWIPTVRPNIVIKKQMDELLKNNQIFPLNWVASNHYFSSPRETQEGSWLIKTSEHRPVRCYVYFQLDSKFSNQQTNNRIYDDLKLERIFIRLNSDTHFPKREYRINYKVGGGQDYGRVYSSYLNACNLIHKDDCRPSISYEQFKNLYSLYYFDMSKMDPQIFSSTTQAHITVEYKLNANIPEKYRIHAVLDVERKINLQGVGGRLVKIM